MEQRKNREWLEEHKRLIKEADERQLKLMNADQSKKMEIKLKSSLE